MYSAIDVSFACDFLEENFRPKRTLQETNCRCASYTMKQLSIRITLYGADDVNDAS